MFVLHQYGIIVFDGLMLELYNLSTKQTEVNLQRSPQKFRRHLAYNIVLTIPLEIEVQPVL